MHASRTRFKKEIVCEFMAPARKSNRIIILCGGMPGYPGKKEDLMEFLSKKGYWVFIPRYRGTWESDGKFLKISPEQDVIDVMNGIKKGFTDLWTHASYKLLKPSYYLVGSSFGGPAAILASRDKRVKKAIALSPVIDWIAQGEKDINEHLKFTKSAFGRAYKIDLKNWNKLKTGRFYNPATETKSIDGKKILIIHPEDDKVVHYSPAVLFALKTKGKIIIPKKGGHLSTSIIQMPSVWKKIASFITR